MCVVSMVGDFYGQEWKDYFKPIQNQQTGLQYVFQIPVDPKEFEALKKEVETMKKLLIKAKIYDENNNEPECEMEEKVKKLKEVAKAMGVDLDEIFERKKK